jgi:hypothetical protein
MTEENLICKQQGHDFRYSKLYDGFVCCYCCGVYKDVRELRKEEEKKIKK